MRFWLLLPTESSLAQKPDQTALGMRPCGPTVNDPGEVTFLLGGCIEKFGSRERAAVILTAVSDQCRNHAETVAYKEAVNERLSDFTSISSPRA